MNLQTSLALISVGLAALKGTGKVDPVVLGFIEVALNAVNSALLAIRDAQAKVDPDALKPIEPLT